MWIIVRLGTKRYATVTMCKARTPAVGQLYEVLAGSHNHIQRQNNEHHNQNNVCVALPDVENVTIDWQLTRDSPQSPKSTVLSIIGDVYVTI